MNRLRRLAFASTLGAVAFATAAASAQSLIGERHSLTGYGARKIIEACLSQATRDHFPIALAVVDPAGYLLSYQASDGATGNTGVTAQLKAKTAAKFHRSTAELYEDVKKQVNRASEWLGYFPVPGGYPIVVSGEVVGAMGAGAAGLSGGKDEDCAKAAIRSVIGDGKNAPPASPQPLLAVQKTLTPAAARRLVEAFITNANGQKMRGFAVAVVDPDGNLISFQGSDGSGANALKGAELKAITAAHWRRSTAELAERINKQVNQAPEWMGDFPQPGAVPIFIGNDEVGAIGAGGGVGDQDDRLIVAAVKSVFPNATTARGN